MTLIYYAITFKGKKNHAYSISLSNIRKDISRICLEKEEGEPVPTQ